MTLHARRWSEVPEDTGEVARAILSKDNMYLRLRDDVECWFEDEVFADLFPSHQGRPAESPAVLSLVLILQYVEGWTDRDAARAVATRIDVKYLLGLPLKDRGFHHSVLGAFRNRLIAGSAEERMLSELLGRCEAAELLKGGGRQRTDATHVLAAVREVNGLEMVGETLRHALNVLAEVAPNWLRDQVSEDWFDRYGVRFEMHWLPRKPAERRALAEQIGADGYHLLTVVYGASAAPWIREIAAVQTLREVWVQQYMLRDGQVQRREPENQPPAALMIASPYDVEVRRGRKRQMRWTGGKVHLTETCDEDRPHLIIHVETTPATTNDSRVMSTIQEDLADKGLLPDEHLVDSGYVGAETLVRARKRYDVEIVGPVKADTSWQARAQEGYAAADFVVDWETEAVECPQGKVSRHWRAKEHPPGSHVIEVRFDRKDCTRCPSRARCTRSRKLPRMLHLKPQEEYEALKRAREYEQTEEFRERYKKRAGVEGTISQGTRRFGLRRSRYVGLAKMHLQHLLTAVAINLCRIVDWLNGRYRTHTRCSSFLALKAVT